MEFIQNLGFILLSYPGSMLILGLVYGDSPLFPAELCYYHILFFILIISLAFQLFSSFKKRERMKIFSIKNYFILFYTPSRWLLGCRNYISAIPATSPLPSRHPSPSFTAGTSSFQIIFLTCWRLVSGIVATSLPNRPWADPSNPRILVYGSHSKA